MPPLWLRGLDLNQRPFGYEPNELPGCSTPRYVLILAQIRRRGNSFVDFLPSKVEQWRKKIDVKGIRKAGKEIQRNKISDDKCKEKWESRTAPERGGFGGSFGGAKMEEFKIAAWDESEGKSE